MMQIFLTLPVAFFVYVYIFGCTFFNQLHVLGIYLSLGIGADDIFVFLDAYKQSVNLYRNMDDRMDYAYRRATYSMGVTSATTTIAFMATAISPIMPISSFGLWAASGIVMNYIFVITIFPAILVMHQRKLWNPMNWMKSAADIPASIPSRPTKAPKEGAGGAEDAVEEEEETLNRMQTLLSAYADALANRKVAGSLVAVFAVFFAVMFSQAIQLKPPTEPDKWFPPTHMYQQV